MFSVNTNCPLVKDCIVLKADTWHFHIKKRHPELSERLDDVREVVRDPCYVADSRPGPESKHEGSLVFVSKRVSMSQSCMHVMVERKTAGTFVSTAFFSKTYHGLVRWTKTEQKEQTLVADYDSDADVLYLSVDHPVPAFTEPGDDGLLLRFAVDDQRPCGVTVIAYRREWSGLRDRLVNSIASFLTIDPDIAYKELARVTE